MRWQGGSQKHKGKKHHADLIFLAEEPPNFKSEEHTEHSIPSRPDFGWQQRYPQLSGNVCRKRNRLRRGHGRSWTTCRDKASRTQITRCLPGGAGGKATLLDKLRIVTAIHHRRKAVTSPIYTRRPARKHHARAGCPIRCLRACHLAQECRAAFVSRVLRCRKPQPPSAVSTGEENQGPRKFPPQDPRAERGHSRSAAPGFCVWTCSHRP